MWALLGLTAVAVLFLAALRRARTPVPAGLPVSLCLIVHDQADRLEGMVADLVRLADALGARVTDVVVVDEESGDGTGELLRRLARRYPGIKTLHWPHDTQGRGHVLEAALALCAGHWIVLRQVRAGEAAPAWDIRRALG